MTNQPNFQEIMRLSPFPGSVWSADYEWRGLEDTLRYWQNEAQLDLDPDFQRGHVWTDEQRAAYIEFTLAGGPANRTISFACEGWENTIRGRMVIVDGKQRFDAVLRFVRNELPVCGALYKDWGGRMRFHVARFRFEIADIPRASVLRWYLALNSGGTPHTPAEIERVRALLEAETKNPTIREPGGGED